MTYNDEFASGIDHQQAAGRFNPTSPGLQGTSDSWTSQIQREAAAPHSLLTPLFSNQIGVGMDAATAAERFPDGQLPSNPGGNGMTEDAIVPSALLRMTSGDSEAS